MRPSGFLAGLVVGAVVGLSFSLLTAPRSGKETREDVEQAVEGALSAPLTIRDQVAGAVQSQIDRFQEALAAAQEAAATTEQEMLRDYERALEEARQTT